MSCQICNTADGTKHHYYCPFGEGEVLVVVTEEKANTQYKDYFKWRRNDGKYYIMKPR